MAAVAHCVISARNGRCRRLEPTVNASWSLRSRLPGRTHGGGPTAPIDKIAVVVDNLPDGQGVSTLVRFGERLVRSVGLHIRVVDHAVFHSDTFSEL
jgi:hypothetical protein